VLKAASMSRELDVVLGLSCVLAGSLLSVTANSLIKLAKDADPVQLQFLCYLFQFALVLVCLGFQHLPGAGGNINDLMTTPAKQMRLLVGKALCFAVALGAMVGSLRRLPVGVCTGITYMHPVFTGILARFMFKEEIGLGLMIQTVASCIGVTLIVMPKPGDASAKHVDDSIGLGLALALIAAFGFSCSCICSRALREVAKVKIQLWQDGCAALIFFPIAEAISTRFHREGRTWDSWTKEDVLACFLFAFANLAASLLFITGISLAPTAKAAAFMYAEVPFSFIAQALLFNESVTAVQCTGAIFITSSALVSLCLEAMKYRYGERTPLIQHQKGTKTLESTSTPRQSPDFKLNDASRQVPEEKKTDSTSSTPNGRVHSLDDDELDFGFFRHVSPRAPGTPRQSSIPPKLKTTMRPQPRALTSP